MAHETTDTIDPLFKVRNSPLQGVEVNRSPYYRKLMSAGYKGYLQGSLGGATLFGGLGAVAGVVMAIAAAPFTGGGSIPFLAVPIMAGAGLLYGKETFGTIGAMAAISAEQAELSETRRNLLDRYYETPSIDEAKEIEHQLSEQGHEKMPAKWFHMKSGLLGAAVVATAAIIGFAILSSTGDIQILEQLAEHFGFLEKVTKALGVSHATGVGFAVSAAIGAAIGSVVGVDRAYIRKWFDVQEKFHDSVEGEPVQIQHTQKVERLRQAYKAEGFGHEARKIPQELIRENGDNTKPISPRALEPKQEAKPTTTLETAPLTTLAEKAERETAPLKERARELA